MKHDTIEVLVPETRYYYEEQRLSIEYGREAMDRNAYRSALVEYGYEVSDAVGEGVEEAELYVLEEEGCPYALRRSRDDLAFSRAVEVFPSKGTKHL